MPPVFSQEVGYWSTPVLYGMENRNETGKPMFGENAKQYGRNAIFIGGASG